MSVRISRPSPVLRGKDAKRFAEYLLNPPPPTPEMIEFAKAAKETFEKHGPPKRRDKDD